MVRSALSSYRITPECGTKIGVKALFSQFGYRNGCGFESKEETNISERLNQINIALNSIFDTFYSTAVLRTISGVVDALALGL